MVIPDELQSRLKSLRGNSNPSESEVKTMLKVETHPPKRRTLNQSRRTNDRFLRENKLLMCALRQNKNVATPPLENYADNLLATIHRFTESATHIPVHKWQIGNRSIAPNIRQASLMRVMERPEHTGLVELLCGSIDLLKWRLDTL
jgi:primosomal protein N''